MLQPDKNEIYSQLYHLYWIRHALLGCTKQGQSELNCGYGGHRGKRETRVFCWMEKVVERHFIYRRRAGGARRSSRVFVLNKLTSRTKDYFWTFFFFFFFIGPPLIRSVYIYNILQTSPNQLMMPSQSAALLLQSTLRC